MQLIVSTIVFVVKANNGGETRKYYYCTSYICGALPQPSNRREITSTCCPPPLPANKCTDCKIKPFRV